MRTLGAAAALLNGVICLWALAKGFHLEGTREAITEAEVGQRMAAFAVPGLVLGLVGAARRGGGARVGAFLSLVLAAVALAIALT